MFRGGVLILVLSLPMNSFLHSQEEHKKIVEEVSVSWWQVPVFAVDKSGNPVTDLEPADIEVRMNGRQLPAFTLYKRSFRVTTQGKDQAVEESVGEQLPIKKKKCCFCCSIGHYPAKLPPARQKKSLKKLSWKRKRTPGFLL